MKKLQIFYQVFGFFFFLTIQLFSGCSEIYFPGYIITGLQVCVIERGKHFHPNQVCTNPLFFRHLNSGKTEGNLVRCGGS